MKALIVDDSRAVRAMLRRLMTGLGFECMEAGDGVDALEVLDRHGAVDVALVDWNMPNMDGLEFIKTMRRDRRWSAISVVMVSAESDRARIARALMVGADAYATKPINAETLEAKLTDVGVLA